MRRLNLNHRLVLAYAMAALLCGASLNATAQTTTTTTLTPAQQQAKAQALARQQQAADAKAKAQAAAQARAQAVAAAKAKAAGTTTQTVPATQSKSTAVVPPAKATPRNTFFAPTQPAAATTATTTATTPAAATTTTAPAKNSFLSNFLNNSGSGGGSGSGGSSSGGGSPVGPDSAGRTSSGNTFAAGLGRFEYGDTSAVAYGCLRSGTRVFCDFDEFKQNPAQVNAGWAYNGSKLVMNGGHIIGVSRAIYVDSDGSTFPTAQLSPSAPVRMMLEFDDVPDTQNAVTLSFNNKQIQNVGITAMNLQENGNLAARGSNGQQGGPSQGQQQVAASQPAAAAAPQSASDKATNAVSNVQAQKSKWGSILGQAKSLGSKPQ